MAILMVTADHLLVERPVTTICVCERDCVQERDEREIEREREREEEEEEEEQG